jgi:hypothetical protein
MSLRKPNCSIIVRDKVITLDLFASIFSSPYLDQEVVAKLAEMDFIVADLERANSRVAAVERRNVSSSLHNLISICSYLYRKFFVQKSKLSVVGMILAIGKC